MPRAIWSGAISFGLVNVPVRMYSAIQEHDLHFHYIHRTDGSRIGYSKICKEEEKPVPEEEIAKAFEFKDGEYVVMEAEDFDAAADHEQGKTIEIRDFVDYDEIDPIYFERTYYLGPANGAEKVYALLTKAMDQSGLAAIVKYVLRDKQSLGCLRVREGVITLEKMYFGAEIRPLEGIVESSPRVSSQELDMAMQLIDKLRTGFEPDRYCDTYRDTLCEIINAKRKGDTISSPEPSAPKAVPDLMAALEASRSGDSSGGGSESGSGSNGSGGEDLEALSKEELYERAKKADIPGRSDMSKEELAEALGAAA